MKMKSITNTFTTNHRKPQYPLSAPGKRLNGNGACHPPKKRVAASADTVIMFMYSAMKNMAKRIEEYSVWKPPTSSPSASGRSNGARLVSPTIEVRYTRNDGSRMNTNQVPSCAATIPEVDMVPA